MKLAVSFAVVIALAISVGVVGYIGMGSLTNSAQGLYQYNLLPVKAMGNLRELFNLERSDMRNIFLSKDDSEKVKSLINGFSAYAATANENFALYEAAILPGMEGDEAAYFSAKEVYLGAFAQMKKDTFALIEKGDWNEAYKVFIDRGASIIPPISNGFAESTAQNDAWALEDSQKTIDLHNMLTLILVIVLAVAVAIAVFFARYISGLISKPLSLMAGILTQIGVRGDLELPPEIAKQADDEAKREDEIGVCAKAFIELIKHLTSVNQTLACVAGGDLTVNVTQLSERDSMGSSLAGMVDNLGKMFMDINTSSSQVSAGSQQVAQAAQELASGSSQQAASIEEFSAALAGMEQKTMHNAENSRLAQEANEKVESLIVDSVQSMGGLLEAMHGIDESSKSITRVIKVIDDIAFQTNILALNAAVEAARAGQHGKGFAVVADEVRNLAAKSAEAAKETAGLIEGSAQRVNDGNRMVEQTNSRLDAVAENARESVRLVNEVTAACGEQTKSINEINRGMEQISIVVQSNSATAEQSAAASQQMSAQAVLLGEIVARFKLKGGERTLTGRNKALSDGFALSDAESGEGGKY